MRKQEMSYRDNYDNIKWSKCTFKSTKATKNHRMSFQMMHLVQGTPCLVGERTPGPVPFPTEIQDSFQILRNAVGP